MTKNIIKTSLLATALAMSIGSGIDTSASAHGFGGFGGGHGPVISPGRGMGHGPMGGGHFGGWGGGTHWSGYYGNRWFPRHGYGYGSWGYGYPVTYSPCLPGLHRNPWGSCVPTYFRPY